MFKGKPACEGRSDRDRKCFLSVKLLARGGAREIEGAQGQRSCNVAMTLPKIITSEMKNFEHVCFRCRNCDRYYKSTKNHAFLLKIISQAHTIQNTPRES